MAPSGDVAHKARRRATKIALRTFQRAANFVGATEAGEPIVELVGVRLVLPEGAQHFRRLAQCSRCGKESWGDPVLTNVQLASSGHIFCDECASGSVDFYQPPTQPEEEPAGPEGQEEHPGVPATFEPVEIDVRATDAAAADGGLAAFAAAVQDAFARHQDQLARVQAGQFELVRRDLSHQLDQGLAAHESAFSGLETTLLDVLKQQHEAHERAVESKLSERYQLLVNQLAASLGDRLEKHRQQLDGTVTRHLQQAQQQLAQRAEALGDRLEQDRQQLDGTVTSQLQQAQQQLAQLADALGDRLDQDRQQLDGTVATQLQQAQQQLAQLAETLGDRLEQHRKQLDGTLARQLEQAQQQLAAQLARAIGDRLEQHRQQLDATVASQLQQGQQQLARLAETLGGQLEQHRQQLDATVASHLQQGQQQLPAQLAETLGDRLEQHRQQLDGTVANQLLQAEQRLGAQFGGAFDERMEQHRQSVEALLGSQLKRSHQATVTELQTATPLIDEHSGRTMGALDQRLTDALAGQQRALADHAEELALRIEETLVDLRDRDRERRTREVLTIVRELVDRLEESQEDLSKGLDHMADRAAGAGQLQVALLQAMGQRLLGSVAGITSQMTQLRVEVALAEQGVRDVRSDLEEFRSLVTVPALGVGHQARIALFAGMGVASPSDTAEEGSERGAEHLPDERPSLAEAAPVRARPAPRTSRSATARKAAATKRATVRKSSGTATTRPITTKAVPATKATKATKGMKGTTATTATKSAKTTTATKSAKTTTATKATKSAKTTKSAKAPEATVTRKRAVAPKRAGAAEPVRKRVPANRTVAKAVRTRADATRPAAVESGAENPVKGRLATARRALESRES